MSTSARMKELYKEIQHSLFDMIPEKWNKIFLYASVIDGRNSLETGEMYFYYIPKGILKREPVNVYEVPNKFNLEENSYFKMADDLYGIIKKLRKEYIAINGALWTNIVISIADYTFKVEYGFENLATSPYSNYDRRYQYLSSFFPDSSFVRSSRQDASSFRIKIAYTMRERNSIFSGAVSCPYQVNQTYFVPATYLEDGVKLPLKDRYESIEDFGQTIFYDLKFHDFQFSDTMLEKLCVKFGRDGKLREVRTKREIPYVYYQLDEKTGDATLMVNGREGTDNDLLSFFVFMPRDDKSLIVPSKLEIKEYKKHYADFPFKLNSYLEKNKS